MNASDIKTIERVSVKDAPLIPGLSFRHFQGDEDYPAILEVNRASKVADGLEHDLHTLDTIRHAYGTTPNHNPHRDVLIAEVNDEMVAFTRVFWERELDGPRVYLHFGFVVPEWRGKGLGRAMIRWSEGRAREIEAEQPHEGVAEIMSGAYSSMPGLQNLLKDEGYEAVRYSYHMETPDLDHIPDAPMPEGLEVRPAKPEHYRAIWEATTEAFRDHWGASETGEEDFERWLADPMFQPELWMVAWDGEQVAGSILNYINHNYNELIGRKLGYTEGISVRRPWRKKGLARALLARSMKLHKDQGMTQTALGVDAQNPSGALRLYESMGYKVLSESTTYRKPHQG
ncbi:MAG TPA: GNAT family N-acetyltransferase [Chloroflexia bacterium]|nr:GNAT family N-acetyltransferase [Chloroflexia bacterium]